MYVTYVCNFLRKLGLKVYINSHKYYINSKGKKIAEISFSKIIMLMCYIFLEIENNAKKEKISHIR